MKKISRILALILAVMLTFAAHSATIAAASSASKTSDDYGMQAIKQFFEYKMYEDALALLFRFHLAAKKDYDVTYSAKLFDLNGREIAAWPDYTVNKHTARHTHSFRLDKCNAGLMAGAPHTFRLTGSVNTGNTTQAYYWAYTFDHDPAIFDFTVEDLGLSVSANTAFKADANDAFTADLQLRATKKYDAFYLVEAYSAAGEFYASWPGKTVSSGGNEGFRPVTSDTSVLPKHPLPDGAYEMFVYGMVDFGGVSKAFQWKYTSEVDSAAPPVAVSVPSGPSSGSPGSGSMFSPSTPSRQSTCSSCFGNGSRQCTSCNGAGQTSKWVSGYGGTPGKYERFRCTSCGGSGRKSCSPCGGSGKR